ncbi:cadherin-like beta sandwich domain-containing protein [Paenibacillus thalictri]|uniref:cadherin-like beta sandwich domain-containing protein n=1 Tax=Paenibacillus thalictri TaxID=2527873 RepID=UPI0013EF15DF|nr:cadherin-like beta sandwich domain-containing protein [Paenibacillus thalictri]
MTAARVIVWLPIAILIAFLFCFLGVTAAKAASTNVALNKTAASSCSSAPYAASGAVDGSIAPTARWYCSVGISGEPMWLQVDLGTTYRVDSYSLTGMGQLGGGWDASLNPRSFRLQKSNDAKSWTDVDTVTGNNESIVTRGQFSPFDSRYVRVYIDQGNQTNNMWASIMELQVFGDLPPSSNADLSGLLLSSAESNDLVELEPAFSAGDQEYTAAVAYTVYSVNLKPITAEPNATVTVNGAHLSAGSAASIPLSVGSNTISVVVTAQDGLSSKTYSLTVTRAKSSNADLSGFSLTSGAPNETITLSPVFQPANINYTSTVSSDVYSVRISAVTAELGADLSISVNGTTVTGAAYSNLLTGDNVIKVTVTAPDLLTTKQYTVHVTKLESSNNEVSAVLYGDVPLTRGGDSFALDVGYEINHAAFRVLLSDPAASFTVTGATYSAGTGSVVLPSLPLGTNGFTIQAKAPNGAVKNYSVSVTRSPQPSLGYIDLNQDGIVDINDVIKLANQVYDINLDDKVDGDDVTFMLLQIRTLTAER